MQKLLILPIIFILVVIATYSCQKPLPNGGKPFYIVIDSTKVEVSNPGVQGSASSKIEQVWVEVGGNNLGVYTLPIKFPVISEGGQYRMLVQPGIKNKGISAQRQIYPMLESSFEDITFSNANNTSYVFPIFKYKSACVFEMNETFEFSSNFDSYLSVVNDANSFEGLNCGMMELAPLSGKTTRTNLVNIPIGKIAYLEFNYKTDMPFAVGILSTESGNTTDAQLVVVDKKDKWNKMYVEITPEISTFNTENYQFYLKSYNEDSSATKKLYVDNFKVIYL